MVCRFGTFFERGILNSTACRTLDKLQLVIANS